ncbi:hypothetical protein [Alicyclobacillus dauci]|uniref:Sporulation protein YhaL n=1 Tax=Alicyclobacillus dauci TaxID=1475485 RepID=A0ABY6Z697_9BACL|nr:hypothetical protein [Alicyclobacillus dauci]WAH38289.1 hypothetical protein NZD86_07345 [Alicyclobacillus dauci]
MLMKRSAVANLIMATLALIVFTAVGRDRYNFVAVYIPLMLYGIIWVLLLNKQLKLDEKNENGSQEEMKQISQRMREEREYRAPRFKKPPSHR